MTDASASAAPQNPHSPHTMTNTVPSPIIVTYKDEPLIPHAPIQDFRDTWWFFDSIVRLPIGDGRSGKVMVYSDPDRPRLSTRIFNIDVFPGLAVKVDSEREMHITKPAHRTAEEAHNGQQV